MDGENGVARVVLVKKESLELNLIQLFFKGRQDIIKLPFDVLPLLTQLYQNLQLVFLLLELLGELQLALDIFLGLLEGPELLRIFPGLRGFQPSVQGINGRLLRGKVKENLAALPTWRGALLP
jgi:hypothetical protein